MIKLVTFTDSRMTISANKCAESAMKHGADSYSIWTPNDLDLWFKEKMAKVLAVPFGAGLYCWKAFIVWKELFAMKDGDVLVYADAGNEWIADMRLPIQTMKDECLFFSNGWPNGDWCKMDVAEAIVGSDRLQDFLKSPQLQASTMFFRVGPTSKSVVWDWLHLSTNENFIDNSPSISPNVPTFQETRWDQSILSAIAFTWGIPLHWFPTTTAEHLRHLHPNDKYPILLNHHRKRNSDW